MTDAFMFPHELPNFILGWYNDYIHDLLWIKQKNIILLIRGYEQMLAGNLNLKKEVISDFEEITLPWWGARLSDTWLAEVPGGFLYNLKYSFPRNIQASLQMWL